MTYLGGRWCLSVAVVAAGLLAGCEQRLGQTIAASVEDIGAKGWQAQLADDSDGRDWPAFGRTYGEQHFSPLHEINPDTVDKLGLQWSLDLPAGNPVTGPIAVGGIVYVASGYSVTRAIDARSGRLLWTYDPKAPEASGHRLRQGWGSRGVAYWNGKIYVATQDGRLVALDAKTGQPVWTAQTLADGDERFISGPPRTFAGMVIIGNAGADAAPGRGYATAYDAETGAQRWRFHTVPGNPADGFESKAMAMAAKTWAGEWWKHGGGGTVWNAITYDKESDTIYLGTGNGSPWNRKIRSAGKGDNLFLCSIVALNAKTGAYKWHYQVNPGESWDYNAAMDMQLADLVIEGRPRKVLMTAPKNGFFYVLDRTDGKLISAKPFVTTTWAKSIDLKSGRPVEEPGIRYENGPATLRPSPVGAHSWTPMAYDPRAKLVFIPAIDFQATYDDRTVDVANWKRVGGMALNYGVGAAFGPVPGTPQGTLVAWDPVAQKAAWRLPMESHFNGGLMATGGGLLFQGRPDSSFSAYESKTGKLLWSFDARAPVIAPPISYEVDGRQYVTVISGIGTSAGLFGALFEKYGIEYRTQARRVLTFAIGGKAELPPKTAFKRKAVDDPDYRADAVSAKAGEGIFNLRCAVCHGGGAVAGGSAPDLRTSGVILSPEALASVLDGALVPAGMPQFQELDEAERGHVRQYLRERAAELRGPRH